MDCELENTINHSVSKRKTSPSPVTLSILHKLVAGGCKNRSDESLLVTETRSEWGRRRQWFVQGRVLPPPAAVEHPGNTPPSQGGARGSGVMACSPTSCPALADRAAAGTVGSDYEYKKPLRRPQRGPSYVHHTLASKHFVEFADFFLCFVFYKTKVKKL